MLMVGKAVGRVSVSDTSENAERLARRASSHRACEGELRDADTIGTSMARLFRLSAYANARASSKGGLERSAFGLLVNLAKHGPCRSSALAELVFVDPSTVSRQVAGLVSDGLVERRADASDGRVSVLAITEAGENLLIRHRDWRNRGIAAIVADWPLEDRRRFADLFEAFTVDYERYFPELLEAMEQEFHRDE